MPPLHPLTLAQGLRPAAITSAVSQRGKEPLPEGVKRWLNGTAGTHTQACPNASGIELRRLHGYVARFTTSDIHNHISRSRRVQGGGAGVALGKKTIECLCYQRQAYEEGGRRAMHFRRSFQEPAAENDTARLAHGRWWEVRHTDGERIEADEEQEAVSPNLGRQRLRLRQLCLIDQDAAATGCEEFLCC